MKVTSDTFGKFIIGAAIGLGAPTMAHAELQKLISHKHLEAFIEKGVCTEEIDITITSMSTVDFEGDKVEVQELIGGARAVLPFQCPAAQRANIIGQVSGKTVYRGSIDFQGSGALVDAGNEASTVAQTQEATTADTSGEPPSEKTADASAAGSQAAPAADETPAPTPAAPVNNAAVFEKYDAMTHNGALVVNTAFFSSYSNYSQSGGQPKTNPNQAASAVMDLAVYKAFPELGQKIETAAPLLRYMARAEQEKYLRSANHANGLTFGYAVQPSIWKGADEFQRRAAMNAFLKDAAPGVAVSGPSLPMRVVTQTRVNLGSYDYEKQGFPLNGANTPKGGSMGLPSSQIFQMARMVDAPEPFLPVNETEAPVLLERLREAGKATSGPYTSNSNNRTVYQLHTIDIDGIQRVDLTAMNSSDPRSLFGFRARLVSVELFEDDKFTKKLHAFEIKTDDTENLKRSGAPLFMTQDLAQLLYLRNNPDEVTEADFNYWAISRAQEETIAISNSMASRDQNSWDYFYSAGLTYAINNYSKVDAATADAFAQWSKTRISELSDEVTIRAQPASYHFANKDKVYFPAVFSSVQIAGGAGLSQQERLEVMAFAGVENPVSYTMSLSNPNQGATRKAVFIVDGVVNDSELDLSSISSEVRSTVQAADLAVEISKIETTTVPPLKEGGPSSELLVITATPKRVIFRDGLGEPVSEAAFDTLRVAAPVAAEQ